MSWFTAQPGDATEEVQPGGEEDQRRRQLPISQYLRSAVQVGPSKTRGNDLLQLPAHATWVSSCNLDPAAAETANRHLWMRFDGIAGTRSSMQMCGGCACITCAAILSGMHNSCRMTTGSTAGRWSSQAHGATMSLCKCVCCGGCCISCFQAAQLGLLRKISLRCCDYMSGHL